MKIISDIANTIEDLLDCAEVHINCALMKKEEYPQVAEVYYKISLAEMEHMNLLHTQIVNLINDYKKTHGDPPERMMGRQEYIHEQEIKKANKVKFLQAQFK